MESKSIWPIILGISEEDWKKIKTEFQNFAIQLSKFKDDIDRILKGVNSFIEEYRPVIENLNEDFIEKIFVEYLSGTHKKLIENGYFVGLSGWNFGNINKINALLDEGDQKEIEKFLLGLLMNNQNLNYFSRKWIKNLYFKSRMKFLSRGLNAHLEKDYIVSIPVLLPHIEAILAEFFVNAGLLSEIPDKFQGNDALSILKTISIDEICKELDRRYFRRFLNKKGVYDFKDNSSYLNRGKILHGTCLSYDREEWSAQLIYLLDFLCDLTSQEYNLSIGTDGRRVLQRKLEQA